MPNYISISLTATILGVCTKTIRRWDLSGVLKPAFRTAGNHRRYDLSNIKAFLNIKTGTPVPLSELESGQLQPRAALYTRVSSSVQKNRGDLQRQEDKLIQYCSESGIKVLRTFKDVGSGLNDSRKGLHELIKFVSRGQCEIVFIAYPDRLARFGINVLKTCFAEWGVALHVLDNPVSTVSKEAELVNDITAILYSYMGKLYRMRRSNVKKDGSEVGNSNYLLNYK
jgi:predicted site-specific integrase-resolvase